jgi:hypothetical protein
MHTSNFLLLTGLELVTNTQKALEGRVVLEWWHTDFMLPRVIAAGKDSRSRMQLGEI